VFKPAVSVRPIDCGMSQLEKSRSYYSKEELNGFPLEINAIRTKLFKKKLAVASLNSGVHFNVTSRDYMVGQEDDPALRGLELKLCPIRVRNKLFAQKALLKYQKHLNANPNKTDEQKLLSMAAASARLSRWSRRVALETARLDALRARDQDYDLPINDEPVDIPLFPYPATNKRRRVTLDEEDSQPAKKKRSC